MKKINSIWLYSLFVLGFQMTVFSQNTSLPASANPSNGGSNNVAIGANTLENNIGNFNVGVGFDAMRLNNTGSENVAIGFRSLFASSFGTGNIAIGRLAMSGLNTNNSLVNPSNSITGKGNYAIGFQSLNSITSGNHNIGIGYRTAWKNSTGLNNTVIGYQSMISSIEGNNNSVLGSRGLFQLIEGNNNLALGLDSGQHLLKGSSNVFIGSVSVIQDSEFSGRVIIASGGAHRVYITENGNTGIGLGNNILPSNRLEINSTATGVVANTMGLRFRGISNSNFTPTATSTRRVLSVNQVGDVILVDDIAGGVNQNCSTANFIPVNSTTVGQLNCSQIFDNGTSVGVGIINPTANNWSYNWLSLNGPNNTPSSGTVKLDVNGVIRTTGVQSLSDKQFKKDIKPIELALETIQKIDGKTYLWNKEANKEMNFDEGLHSGFIAQELEKVLPHLVATDGAGNKAVNYTELIPYLVEAIKEQQIQINDLKAQLTENFKTQNQDLIELNNTKIISVSPNPSNDFITVSFNVEKSIQNAKLNVHDLNGNVIVSLNINDRDNNINRTLQRDNFGKGIYIVSLIVNGKSIDTKKIVFN